MLHNYDDQRERELDEQFKAEQALLDTRKDVEAINEQLENDE